MVQGIHNTSGVQLHGSEQYPRVLDFRHTRKWRVNQATTAQFRVQEQWQNLGSSYRTTLFLNVQLSTLIAMLSVPILLKPCQCPPLTRVIGLSLALKFHIAGSRALGILVKEHQGGREGQFTKLGLLPRQQLKVDYEWRTWKILEQRTDAQTIPRNEPQPGINQNQRQNLASEENENHSHRQDAKRREIVPYQEGPAPYTFPTGCLFCSSPGPTICTCIISSMVETSIYIRYPIFVQYLRIQSTS